VERISWSVTSQYDLEAIGDFIAKDSPFYAVDFVERVIQAVDQLLEFPELGRVVPEFNNADLREIIFHGYRIVYKAKDEMIYIVSICHGSQNIFKKSKREAWSIS
jgi:toxin ParE1/3/4